jgi:hypothetical protein
MSEKSEIDGGSDWLERYAPTCRADASGSLGPRLANTIHRNTERPRPTVDSPDLRAPDGAGIVPWLASFMARQHEATVAAVEARNLARSENGGGSR